MNKKALLFDFFGVIADIVGNDVRVNSSVVGLIKNLGEEYKIALCSNGSGDFVRSALETNKLTELFDHIIISTEVGVSKPNPVFFEYTLEKLNLSSRETVFIDDNQGHVRSAEQLGITGIVFSDYNTLVEKLKTALP